MQRSTTDHPGAAQPLILGFDQIRSAELPLVGGKGANLGELTAAGFPVPAGFCITTGAFDRFMDADAAGIYTLLDALDAGDLERVRTVGEQVRARLHAAAIPPEVAGAVLESWREIGAEHAYAVRSSATAEDLPDASFAGQQDTYLNVRGEEALLDSVRRCWASLFTDRAILYRMQNGFDHREVRLSVVVQRMVEPQVSGIMFTADPVSGRRRTISIDASFGLGEALVGGLVSADLYQVDSATRRITKRQIADKQLMIRSLPAGGVEQVAIPAAERQRPALDDRQVLELAALGARIEQHYRAPQDIEWALVDGKLYILQARPITSLYPLPGELGAAGEPLRVYFSFSHVQVMTDPMPELSISLWRTIFPFGRPPGEQLNPLVRPAGGRIYIDVSALLRHPVLKRLMPRVLVVADRMAAAALGQVSQRPEFQRSGPAARTRSVARWALPLFGRLAATLLWRRPEGVAAQKTAFIEQHAARLRSQLLRLPTPAARLDRMLDELGNAFVRLVYPWAPYPFAGVLAHVLLGRVARRFADPQDLIALTRGLHGNVTTEMDMAVGDLADLVRGQPALLAHLSQGAIPADRLLAGAGDLPGGHEFLAGWNRFIEHYGMRGPSEIDASRVRWAEQPGSLLQMVLGNAQHGEVGAHRAHHRRMAAEGDAAAARIEAAAGRGPLGFLRRPLAHRLIRLARNLIPLREHPKFMLIQLLWLFKQAALEAGAALAAQGRLAAAEDVWFLTIPELRSALAGPGEPLLALVAGRRAALARFSKLQAPRVMTSEGEIPAVTQASGHAPAGALVGSPVSAGVAEGLARVVRDPQTEMLNPGEILVAPFTDPGWTPLFINAAGLVMEVGGLMTHGSVVAREYGIPAVVGVPDATTRIKTGQRLRVHGEAGYVEILDDVPEPAGATLVVA
jgi:pyruvate,water dikinase